MDPWKLPRRTWMDGVKDHIVTSRDIVYRELDRLYCPVVGQMLQNW